MKKKFSIIKNVYLRLFVAIILVISSWALFGLNAKFSSEFTGWVKMTVAWNLEKDKLIDDLERYLNDQGFENTKVELDSEPDQTILTIKTNVEDDARVTELSDQLKWFLLDDKYISNYDDILDLSITWPSVWSYMQKAAIIALIVGVLFMAIYMLFSFASIRKYIAPLVLAIVTIVTMLFDISIPVWAYWFWMMINPTIQIDTIFVIAILTTMWYSINDTIIIFDRIRENMREHGDREKWTLIYGKVFEKSLRQTMRRSMWTSISTLLVIIAMYILWTWVIQQFAFTMWVGVIAGTFSSIFVAAPLAYLILWKYKKERKKL